ncbi:hypothetical protein BJY01DRAFT_249758 [Aspergillus pseudoustus]|uniref:Uncharacterized protein n=1 Tax=Aspergillus pseudoustus TaxID=1810923 RepID=A0ABR4JM18_9EURO
MEYMQHRDNGTEVPVPPTALRPNWTTSIGSWLVMRRDPVAWLLSGNALELYYEVAYAEEARQRRLAATDASRLASEYGLPNPIEIPSAQHEAFGACLSRVTQDQDTAAFLSVELDCLVKTAAKQALPIPTEADLVRLKQEELQANAARREKLGHYLPAMWQYRGEWSWVLDRLHFLSLRLQVQGALAQGTVIGFRSPYSYLAAVELRRRRAGGGKMPHPRMVVRPILPMAKRGLPVPLAKRFYIARDAKQWVDALHVAFGCISNPVGEGVLLLLALFPTEASVDEQLRYCVVAEQAVWAEGLDVRRDDVLQSVVERAGGAGVWTGRIRKRC